MPDLSLRICGVTLCLSGEDGEFLQAARERYAPFRGDGRADLHFDLRTRPAVRGPHQDEPRVRERRGKVEVRRHDLDLEFFRTRGRATVVRSPSALDSLLRIALSFELFKRGGFLCHAAAFDGWLFPGRSGAGKSTLGLSTPQDRLLADEHVGVVGEKLYGTPFWGDFRAGRNNFSRPLRAIYFLDRASPRGVHRVSKPEALRRLLECVLFFSNDPVAAKKILALARECVERVPTCLLSYDARRMSFARLEKMIKNA